MPSNTSSSPTAYLSPTTTMPPTTPPTTPPSQMAYPSPATSPINNDAENSADDTSSSSYDDDNNVADKNDTGNPSPSPNDLNNTTLTPWLQAAERALARLITDVHECSMTAQHNLVASAQIREYSAWIGQLQLWVLEVEVRELGVERREELGRRIVGCRVAWEGWRGEWERREGCEGEGSGDGSEEDGEDEDDEEGDGEFGVDEGSESGSDGEDSMVRSWVAGC